MTWVFQVGLATEAVLNLVGAIPFILFPEWFLLFVVAPDSQLSVSSVPPSAAVLFQIYGGLVLALTLPLVLCIPASSAVAEKRQIVFKTLTAGEVCLIAILLWNASRSDPTGFTKTTLIASAFFLLPALGWHGFALFVKPELMLEDMGDMGFSANKKKNL